MATQTLLQENTLALSGTVRRWDRRLRLQQTLTWLPRGLMPGLIIGLVLEAISRLRPWLLPREVALITAGLALLGALLSALAVWLWRRPTLTSARRFDRQFRLGERVSTALELGMGTIRTNDELRLRQMADARVHADAVRVREHIPLAVRRRDWSIVLALAAILALLLILPNPQVDALSQASLQQAAINAAADQLRTATQDVAADASLGNEERQTLLEQLKTATNTLNQPNVTPEEALAAVSDVQADLKNSADSQNQQASANQEALQQAANALRQAAGANSGNQSPSDSMQSINQSLSQLGQNASTMTDAQRQQAAQQMQQAAQALQNTNPQAAQQMRQAAQQLQAGQNQAAQQQMQQAQQQMQQQAQQAQMQQQSAQNLSNAAQQTQQSGQQISQSQQQNQQAQQSQQQSQQSQQSQQGQQGQQGQQSQQNQQGQQSQQNQQGQAQAQQQNQQGQQGQQGQQSQQNQQGQQNQQSQQGQQPGQQGLQGEQGQQPGQGSSAQQAQAQQQGQQGQQPGQGNQSGNQPSSAPSAGDAPGSQTGDDSSGQPQQTTGNAATNNNPDGQGEGQFEAVNVPRRIGAQANDGNNVQLEPDASNAPVQEGDFSQNPNGQVTVPYDQVYSNYADAANRALNSDYVPLGLRDVVRDYFTSIEPKK